MSDEATPAAEAASSAKPEPRPIRVRQFVDPAELKRDLTFSDVNITDAMMQQPALFAYYGTKAAEAERQVQDFERVLEETEAKLDKKIRIALLNEGVKITEAMIEKEIKRHPVYIQVNKALIEAREIAAKLKIATEAFRHRRDMLIQVGATHREERKGEIATVVRDARHEAAKASASRLLQQHHNEDAAA